MDGSVRWFSCGRRRLSAGIGPDSSCTGSGSRGIALVPSSCGAFNLGSITPHDGKIFRPQSKNLCRTALSSRIAAISRRMEFGEAQVKTEADFTDESPTVDQFLRDSSELSSAIEERF